MMAAKRKIISAKAHPGKRKPKNIADQAMFSKNCKKKAKRAALTFFREVFSLQTKNSATPISAKRTVQTGAKIQFGGARSGFARFAYHSGIAGAVNSDPEAPTASQARMETASLQSINFFIMIILSLFPARDGGKIR